jgi:hypothetical protein
LLVAAVAAYFFIPSVKNWVNTKILKK